MTTSIARGLALSAAGFNIVMLGACKANSSDAAVVTLRNDTANKVELRLCSDDHCKKDLSPPRYKLGVGDSVEVNVSKSGVPNVYIVLADQKRAGCLPIVVNDSAASTTLEVSISARRPCSDEVPKEWPARKTD